MRNHKPETKADHLACFNMHMMRHKAAYAWASYWAHHSFFRDENASRCYQQEQAYHYAQADYHRECYKTAPIERGGWRPY